MRVHKSQFQLLESLLVSCALNAFPSLHLLFALSELLQRVQNKGVL